MEICDEIHGVIAYSAYSSIKPPIRKSIYYGIMALLLIHFSQVQAPNKKMQFIMKYIMLFHINPSHKKAANNKIQFFMKYMRLSHIDPGQVQAPIQENAIYLGIHDVIA